MEIKNHGSEDRRDAVFMQHDTVRWLIRHRKPSLAVDITAINGGKCP